MARLESDLEPFASRPGWSLSLGRQFTGNARPFWPWLGFAAAVAAIIFLADWFAGQVGQQRLRDSGAHRLEIYAAGLRSELAKYEYLPGLLTLERDVMMALRDPGDGAQVDVVNKRLEEINRIAGTAALYVLDRKGVAVAASNWNEEASFVGMDLSYRPYFHDAIGRGEGRFYAIGTTSGLPGFYFARALRDGGQLLGVGALKVSLDHLERAWAGSSDIVLAIDANGVVFLASDAAWKFHTIGRLSDDATERIRASRQYWNVLLRPLDVKSKVALPTDARSVDVGAADAARRSDYLELTQALPEPGWRLVLLADVTPVAELRRLALALAAALSASLLAVVLYARQRRLFVAQSLAAKEALQHANDALEVKVAERTGDLIASNARLQQEIGERRRAEEGLVQAGKLAVLGQMAAGITHELNQPLAALSMLSANACTFLARGRLDNTRENLERIGDLTDRMGKITGQLKAFARKDPVSVRPLAVEQSIHNALFLLDQRIRQSNLEVVLVLPDRPVRVLADATRLEQVLVNLVANALDAMEGRAGACGTIEVIAQDERIAVAVRDNGPGIGQEQLPHLFEPFFTTKEPGKGLGLGLAISSSIARELGGELKARNRPEGGAEFTLCLRRATDQTHD
jgi:two-component system, NtrC family, C4-dicarboxylate transport sensor histidine kinase DctB